VKKVLLDTAKLVDALTQDFDHSKQIGGATKQSLLFTIGLFLLSCMDCTFNDEDKNRKRTQVDRATGSYGQVWC